MAVRIKARPKRRNDSLFSAMIFVGFSVLAGALIISRASSGSMPTQLEQKTKVVAEFDTVSIPVPAKPVTAGMKGKDIAFKLVSFPKSQLPVGVITDISRITDQSATAPLPADLPLFESNFSKNASFSNPVTERIPPGMRAMTIRVDATTAVEGWAGSGALVDILLVTKDQTKVVAEKVRVLSAERSVAPVEGSASPNVPTTLTVLVSQEQCLAINTAIPMGKIAFALRSTQDEQHWDEGVYTADRLKGSGIAGDDKRPQISGYVSVKDDSTGKQNGKKFAFTDGHWVKTDSVPSGFLVGDQN